MNFEPAAIHVEQAPEPATGAFIPSVCATSTYAQLGPGETRGCGYTRSGKSARSPSATGPSASPSASNARASYG